MNRLTAEKVDRFLRTRIDLAALERRQPVGNSGMVEGLNDEAVVALLESSEPAQEILKKHGWTARDYWESHRAIVRALITIARLDSGRRTRVPDGVAEADVQLLRDLAVAPGDLSRRFLEWRRAEMDSLLE